jgi:hypothetical protein
LKPFEWFLFVISDSKKLWKRAGKKKVLLDA